MSLITNVSFQSPDKGMEFQALELLVMELDQEQEDLQKKEELLDRLFDEHSKIIDISEQELYQLEENLQLQAQKLVMIETKRTKTQNEMTDLRLALEDSGSRIKRLQNVLSDGTTRLENMKADFRREEIKRHIKTLKLIHESKTDLTYVEESIGSSIREIDLQHVKYEEAAMKVRNAVDQRKKVLLKIDRYLQEILELEMANDVKSVIPVPGSYDATFAFLETGSGQHEPSGTSYIDILKLMSDFHSTMKKKIWRFNKAPVGPLYHFVHFKEKKWGALVEHILRPHLFTYIVDSAFDQYVLEEMITTFFLNFSTNILDSEIPQPSVIVIEYNSQFEPLENKIIGVEGMSECECINLMDALKFQRNATNNVWKILVADVFNAEKIILFRTEHDAFVLMHNQARESPENQLVYMAYSLDGYEIFPFPNFRTSVIKLTQHALYMQVYKDDTIALLKAELNNREVEVQELTKEIEVHRNEQFSALEKFEKAKRLSHEQHVEKADLEKRITQLNKALVAKFTIQGEILKTEKLAAKIAFLKEENTLKNSLLKKEASRLVKIANAFNEENAILKKLKEMFENKKDVYEENLLCMEMESNVLENQIKMHRETVTLMEKAINQKVDVNCNEIMEDDHNISSSAEAEPKN